MGSLVAVVEVDPIPAIEALMDGYLVMPAAEAAAWGDVFITATGNLNVFRREHFGLMRDGAILANSGHFDAELELGALSELCDNRIREVRQDVQEYDLGDRRIYVLGEGRLVNLAAAEGHPASVMDMSFANQALAAEHVARNHGQLDNKVYTMPDDIDREVARLKLESLGIHIDTMTGEQSRYVSSWEEGT
jgi:adenosylhomocysteinase